LYPGTDEAGLISKREDERKERRAQILPKAQLHEPVRKSMKPSDLPKCCRNLGVAGQVPYGRIGEPPHIAQPMLWLAVDSSDHVNGTTLFVDGGMSLYPAFRGAA
jgi:NAD(P)-dependent dehydrogenase (short-subunit alcohol dehydrogenase family)